MIYKERNLHIPKPNWVNSNDESSSSKVSIPVNMQKTKDADEIDNSVPTDRNNWNEKRELRLSDNRVRGPTEENKDLN